MMVNQNGKLIEIRCSWWIQYFSTFVSKPLTFIGMPLSPAVIVWVTNKSIEGRVIWPTPGPWKRMTVNKRSAGRIQVLIGLWYRFRNFMKAMAGRLFQSFLSSTGNRRAGTIASVPVLKEQVN